MKRFLMASAIIILAGCAPPRLAPMQQQHPAATDSRGESIGDMRAQRDDLRSKVSAAKSKDEINRLQSLIDDLERRIAALEYRQTQAASQPETASGGKNYGPRGGCYTITKSGKKNYKGC